MNPTPADEALAREILKHFGVPMAHIDSVGVTAQLIAAHVAAAMGKNLEELEYHVARAVLAEEKLEALEAVAAQAPSGLVEALEEVLCCFNAAYAEGLHEKMMEAADTEPGSLVDLIQRRLLYAYERTIPDALAAHKAQPVADVRGMVEALDELFNVGLYLGARGLVEGWTGVGKYQPHPDDLPCMLLTNCGTVYRLDEALIKAAKALISARHAMGGEVK